MKTDYFVLLLCLPLLGLGILFKPLFFLLPLAIFILAASILLKKVSRNRLNGSQGNKPNKTNVIIGAVEIVSQSLVIADASLPFEGETIKEIPNGKYPISIETWTDSQGTVIASISLSFDSQLKARFGAVHVDTGFVVIGDRSSIESCADDLAHNKRLLLKTIAEASKDCQSGPIFREISFVSNSPSVYLIESGIGDGSYEIQIKDTIVRCQFL